LSGNRRGQHAIRINDQYRICFVWMKGDATMSRLPITIRSETIMNSLNGNFAIAVHPGDILREMLGDGKISQAQLAGHLRIDLARINEICRRRRGISARMALMLAQALGTSPALW